MELVIQDDEAWGAGRSSELPGCLPLGLIFDWPEETLDPAVTWTVACELLWTDSHRAIGVEMVVPR